MASFKQYPPLIPLLFIIGIAFLWVVRKKWISPLFFKQASLIVLIIVGVNYAFEFIL